MAGGGGGAKIVQPILMVGAGGVKISLQCHGGGAIFFPCILKEGDRGASVFAYQF